LLRAPPLVATDERRASAQAGRSLSHRGKTRLSSLVRPPLHRLSSTRPSTNWHRPQAPIAEESDDGAERKKRRRQRLCARMIRDCAPGGGRAPVGTRTRPSAAGRASARRRRAQGAEDESAAANRRPRCLAGAGSRRVAACLWSPRRRRVCLSLRERRTVAAPRLAQLAPGRVRAGGDRRRCRCITAVRPAPLVRLAAHH
jgi:hypothetical protein